MADFQEHYGLNLWEMGLDGDEDSPEVHRAAALLSQLPPKARVVIAEDPDASWSADTQFLRLIDYDLRAIIHQLAAGKGSKPKPVDLPSVQADLARVADGAAAAQAQVDEALRDILPWTREEPMTTE